MVGFALWALFLVVLFPVDPSIPDKLQGAIVLHALFALVALLGTVLPWRIPSALILFVAFFGAFVWGAGWYFVLLPAFFLVGLGDILYLVAAILMVNATLARRPPHNA